MLLDDSFWVKVAQRSFGFLRGESALPYFISRLSKAVVWMRMLLSTAKNNPKEKVSVRHWTISYLVLSTDAIVLVKGPNTLACMTLCTCKSFCHFRIALTSLCLHL